MNTPDLFADPSPPDIPKARAMRAIRDNPDLFREDFPAWLDEAWALWVRFEREAERMWTIGRRHWSAYTIIEYLRHETALRDPTDANFKFNQRWTSSISRLYGLMHPAHAGLFEFRERADGVVAAFPKGAH